MPTWALLLAGAWLLTRPAPASTRPTAEDARRAAEAARAREELERQRKSQADWQGIGEAIGGLIGKITDRW